MLKETKGEKKNRRKDLSWHSPKKTKKNECQVLTARLRKKAVLPFWEIKVSENGHTEENEKLEAEHDIGKSLSLVYG